MSDEHYEGSAGWQGLTERNVKTITENAPSAEWAVLMAESTLKEKNSQQIEFLYALYQQASSQRDILMAQQTQQVEAWKQRIREAKLEKNE